MIGLCEHAVLTEEGYILCERPAELAIRTIHGPTVIVCAEHAP